MTQDGQRLRHFLMILSGVFVTLIVIVFARLAYGLLLPPMRADLGMSYQQAGLLGTVTALGYFCFVLLGGITAARWGARTSVVFGLTTVSLGFAGMALSNAYPLLMLFMVLLGVGTAFSYAPMVSLLATWFPERRGTVIGFLTSGVGLGMLIIGVLIPWLERLFGTTGWRVTWAVFAVAGVLVALMVACFVRNPPSAAPRDGHPPPPPSDKIAIYTNPRVITVGLVYGIVGLTYIVQTVFMVSFMAESGIPAATAGGLVAMMGMLSLAAGPTWGSLSDRMGRGSSLMLAMALVLGGMILPLIHQSLPVFTIHYGVMGCTGSGLFTLVQAAGTEQVPPRDVPIAFSFVTQFFAGGQFIGPAFAGILIECTGGFHAADGFTCIMLARGVYLASRVRRLPALAAQTETAP
ncbi:MAG: MFS transporter [Ectothiorhodospiraceae bacterium]|nr:MFS transporter [Ectothiorhodospiraceae bacterium]